MACICRALARQKDRREEGQKEGKDRGKKEGKRRKSRPHFFLIYLRKMHAGYSPCLLDLGCFSHSNMQTSHK